VSPPLDLDARILRVRNGSWSAHPDISALLARLDEAEEMARALEWFEEHGITAAQRTRAYTALARWRGEQP
jgi:hypothetical protein